MCIFLYSFSFSLHYRCQFGEFVALLGNTEELGAWDISKAVELQWMEGDIWRSFVSFKQKNNAILQYKYLVCKRIDGEIQAVRWEEGPNRFLNLMKLKKLCVSVDDVWEQRKISIFLKDSNNKLPAAYIIGKGASLGDLSQALEMQKISHICPIEGALQTYWFKQVFVPALIGDAKFTFNYLTVESHKNHWLILGNETSLRINFASEVEEKDQSPEDSKLARGYKNSSGGRIKVRKTTLKTSFENPFFSRLEKNDFQIFQDVLFFEDNNQIFKINDTLHAGSFNSHTLEKAIAQNVKNVLVFTNLRKIKIGDQNLNCITKENYISRNVNINELNLQKRKDILLTECSQLMDKCLKSTESTLICWGNSKRQAFKLLMEYLCTYKKFSLDAAKKFLKISSSKELIKRKSRQIHLSR